MMSRLPRKTSSYLELNPKPEKNSDEEKQFEKLDEMIQRHRSVARWNDLRIEESKLQAQEKELMTMVKEELIGLQEHNKKMRQEYCRKVRALRNYQMLSDLQEYGEKLLQFIQKLEQHFEQPIAVNMDDEQFRIISEKIEAYKKKLPPYHQLDEIRELTDSIHQLQLEESFISRFIQQTTYQQIKIDAIKSDQNAQKLGALPEKIKQLQDALDWTLLK